MNNTTKTAAAEIVAMNDVALRSYYVETLVAKWGDGERAPSEVQAARSSRAQILAAIARDFEGRDQKLILKGARASATKSDRRLWSEGG